jgi:guanylate kinase
MKEGKLIVISGPSGVGKTTLYKRILSDFRDKIDFSVSLTTRKPRSGEIDGKDYRFISKEQFLKKIKDGDFVEWAEVHHNLYGTPKSEINGILGSGKSCLLDLDVQGGVNIKKSFPDAFLIFIMPPSVEELKNRLRSRRTDDNETLETRLQNALKEMSYASHYDMEIINDDLEIAYNQLRDCIMDLLNG